MAARTLPSFRSGTNAITATLCRTHMRQFSSTGSRREIFQDPSHSEFSARVLSPQAAQASKPCLVDFYATWCQPCKILSPTLHKLEKEGVDGKEVDLVTVDVDQHPELAAQFKIRAMPTVALFVHGKPVHTLVGVQPESVFRKAIQTL